VPYAGKPVRIAGLRWCWALFCACVAIFGSKIARAEGRPALTGTWNAGLLVERYNVGDWGSACGPQPEGRDLPGGQVTVREEGDELAIIGDSRTFRTDECWEQLPGVSRTSHTATHRSWQTGCASARNDARQTALVTSVSATDATISLDEVAQYQFRIEGQNCTASARRSRTWTVVRRQGETAIAGPSASPAVTASPPAAAPNGGAMPPGVDGTPARVSGAPARPESLSIPETSAAQPHPLPNRCATPGSPAQVEVRPARKVLRPGDRFTFRTSAVDANGCAVDPKATWVLERSSTSVTLAPGGTVVVEDDAGDGNADFSVTSGGRSTRVQVEVATPARYDSLLSPAESDAAGTEEPAATFSTSASLGASSATAQDTAHARKTIFVLLIGVLALGLAALGLVLVRRAPVAPDTLSPPMQELAVPTGEPPNPRGLIVKPRSAPPKRGMICPSCRSEFPAGSGFCPHDGNRLVVAGAALSFQGPTIGPPGGICPTCGRGYDPGVKTCPTHGDDLVPVAVYRATAHRSPTSQERGKICPSCGGRYGGDAAFCGKDGTALVLVN
jgi:hypothetical protein